jgi:hypothetical protein
MSKFDDYQTLMNDQDCLVESLGSLGRKTVLAKDQVNGDPLFGYEGAQRPERAQVILPRKTLSGASNDIGFRRKENGNFTAVVSQYDSSIGYGKEWLGKVSRVYLEKKAVKDLTAQGYSNFRREEIKNTSGAPDVRITATPPPAYTQAQQVGFSRS